MSNTTTVDRIVWRQDLQRTLGISLDTMSRYIKAPGKLPPPDVNLNSKKIGWKLSTLSAAGIHLPA